MSDPENLPFEPLSNLNQSSSRRGRWKSHKHQINHDVQTQSEADLAAFIRDEVARQVDERLRSLNPFQTNETEGSSQFGVMQGAVPLVDQVLAYDPYEIGERRQHNEDYVVPRLVESVNEALVPVYNRLFVTARDGDPQKVTRESNRVGKLRRKPDGEPDVINHMRWKITKNLGVEDLSGIRYENDLAFFKEGLRDPELKSYDAKIFDTGSNDHIASLTASFQDGNIERIGVGFSYAYQMKALIEGLAKVNGLDSIYYKFVNNFMQKLRSGRSNYWGYDVIVSNPLSLHVKFNQRPQFEATYQLKPEDPLVRFLQYPGAFDEDLAMSRRELAPDEFITSQEYLNLLKAAAQLFPPAES